MKTDTYKAVILTCIILFLTGCNGAPPTNKEQGRLIVAAMDFSQSTKNEDKTKIREHELFLLDRLKECFNVGDTIFLYQITDKSFSKPIQILNISIGYPGSLETKSYVIRKSQRNYTTLLLKNRNDIMQKEYDGTDIIGFLLFSVRQFTGSPYKLKNLLIISDGIESSGYIDQDKVVSENLDQIIAGLTDKNYIAALNGWVVKRTGLWQDINPDILLQYDRFWEKYFKKSNASYENIGFETLETGRDICSILLGEKR